MVIFLSKKSFENKYWLKTNELDWPCRFTLPLKNPALNESAKPFVKLVPHITKAIAGKAFIVIHAAAKCAA